MALGLDVDPDPAMTLGDWVMIVVGVVTLVVAVLAWLHTRPTNPFRATSATRNVFGLERSGYMPVVVEAVRVPEYRQLALSNESANLGPYAMRRGKVLFFGLLLAQAPIDVVVEWRWKIGRKRRYWTTHIL